MKIKVEPLYYPCGLIGKEENLFFFNLAIEKNTTSTDLFQVLNMSPLLSTFRRSLYDTFTKSGGL